MKLFEIEKARMESAGTHSHAYPGQSIESMDIDQLSMRLESLSNDYAMLQASKDESITRPRVIAIENRYGLVSLEKDLALRTEGLGSWIANMIQKVLDAISRFFSWIFGSSGKKESTGKAIETAEKAQEKAKEAEKEESKAVSSGDFVIPTKLEEFPITGLLLKSSFGSYDGNISKLRETIELVEKSVVAFEKFVKVLGGETHKFKEVPFFYLADQLGKAKNTPAFDRGIDAKTLYYSASLRTSGLSFAVFEYGYPGDKDEARPVFVKNVVKADILEPTKPQDFTFEEVSKEILPRLTVLAKKYSDLLATAKTSFDKSTMAYKKLSEENSEDVSIGAIIQAKMILASISVIDSYGWIPNTLNHASSYVNDTIALANRHFEKAKRNALD